MAYYCACGDSSDEDSSDVETRYRVYHRNFPNGLRDMDRSVLDEMAQELNYMFRDCSVTQEIHRREAAMKREATAAAKRAEELRKLREKAAREEANKKAAELIEIQEMQRRKREKAAQEEANKKAAELIEIEEMQRRKREKNIKKHQKKKAKKLAKKHTDNDTPSSAVSKSTQEHNENCETVESNEAETCPEEELDPSSAFAVKSMQKSNLKLSDIPAVEQKDQPMEKSEDLRKLASSLIQQDFLSEACSVLNKAIATAPEDMEIYLERANCFYKLEQYEKAVQDAMVVIESNPRYTQAHVLVSKAYASLKQFDKAEEVLTAAKNVIGYTQEIQAEMKHVGVLKLVELGFEETVAAGAMGRKFNFLDALDELTWDVEKIAQAGKSKGEVEDNASEDGNNAVGLRPSEDGAVSKSCGSVSSGDQDSSAPVPSRSLWVGSVSYSASWEDLHNLFKAYGNIESIYRPPMATFAFVNFATVAEASNALYSLNNYMLYDGSLVIRFAKPNAKFAKESKLAVPATSKKIDPRNPHGIRSIYVANVMSRTTEKELISLFSTCGHVTSCQILRDKKCAFVNYTTSAEATRALETLQSFRHRNVSLVLKFPNNTQNVVIGKNAQSVRSSAAPATQVAAASDECVFWRKGECVFEDKCWQLHIPEHKGIDA